MKRISLSLFLGLLVAIAACSTASSERKTPPLDLDAVATIVRRAPALDSAARDIFAKSSFEASTAGLRRRSAINPHGELVVDAPASSNGTFHAASSGIRRIGVDLTLLDGAARAAELREGRIVYRDVFPASDLLAAADATRLEHFLVLRDESAPHHFAWRVQGGKALTPQIDGNQVEFVDGRGESQVTLLPVVAVDEAGARVEARTTFSDGVLSVDVPDGLHYPIIVDPALETAVWVYRSDVRLPLTQPTADFLTQIGWDPIGGGPLVVGTHTSGNQHFDLTELWKPVAAPSGGQWNVLDQTGLDIVQQDFTTSLRTGVVYHPGRGKVVMLPYMTAASGLYEWSGASWSPITTAHYPPTPRFNVAIAYDASRSVLTLFGGEDSKAFLNDTWEYDGNDFKQIANAGGDTGFKPGMAYDSARQKLVLGTWGGTSLDTWEFENGKWAPKTAAHPPKNTSISEDPIDMVFDPFHGRTVAEISGSTYEWDGTDWMIKSTAGPDGALVYDPARNRVYAIPIGNVLEYHRRGGACTTGSTCDTGYCVDGVCCETSSCGTCAACNLDPTEGTCATVTSGNDDTCPGADQQCSAAGACFTNPGKACTASSQCQSGFCVDGVCCDSACNGLCQACSAASKESGVDSGKCDFAKSGLNPSNGGCVKDMNNACLLDGTCNGRGGCRQGIGGTSCGASSCSGESAVGQLCDGAGHCGPSTVMCSPGLCAAGSCTLACTTDSDCDPEQGFCDSGICKARFASGNNPCTRDAQCSSRSCVDGVCCNSRCTGQCEACDVPNSVGSCIPVTGAPHPARDACPTLATTNDACAVGACDGDTRTSCAGFPGPEVACRAASCTNDVATLAAGCSSKGACAAVQTKSCTPYACAGDACATACASDQDCASNATCALATKTCVTGTTCDGDHTLKAQSGDQDCAPFKCEGSICKKSCNSVDDCVAPALCNTSGQCVSTAASSGGTSGCTMSRHSSGSFASALFALALTLAAVRRRFSSNSASSVSE